MEPNHLLLSDVFSLIKKYFSYYKSLRKVHFFIIALTFICSFLYYSIEKPKYESSASFVLMEGGGSKAGGLASLGSQFGFDIGSMGGQSNDIFTGENIYDIFKTRSIIEKVLLTPYNINESNNSLTLADQYLKMYPSFLYKVILREELPFISFINYNSLHKPDRVLDSVLNKMHKKIIENNLSVQKLNKKGSIIQVKVLTNDEKFSKYFNERIIEAAKAFYLNINNTNTQLVLLGLQRKADSLQGLLYQKSFKSAGLYNANNGLKDYSASEEIMQKDKTVAFALFSEVIKNIEITKMTQAQQTPIFQIIETPRYPLENKKIELPLLLLISTILSICLTFLYALLKYILK